MRVVVENDPDRANDDLRSLQFPRFAGVPILICLLGNFQLMKYDEPLALRERGKAEILLSSLALRPRIIVPRKALLALLWPDSDPSLAHQSLSSLVYTLHKLLGDALGNTAPIINSASGCQLNLAAGIGVDVTIFEQLAAIGKEHARRGNAGEAVGAFHRAIRLYRGDLGAGLDLPVVVERERLRALHLTLQSRLADHFFERADYDACIEHARVILSNDPCREDAHRLFMRCYVRLGERAQALRQFRLCEQVLRTKFDSPPEAATLALFDQVRLNPGAI